MARSLERDWHEQRSVLDQIERDDTERVPAASSQVSEAQRQGIADLVHDLPAVWQADTTTPAERKQVVRLLIKDVTLTQLAQTVRVQGRWHTQACSTREVPRPHPAAVVRRTAPEVLVRIRQLATDHPDIAMAARLNHEGDRSGQGGACAAGKSNGLRDAYGITRGCPVGPVACAPGQRGDGR